MKLIAISLLLVALILPGAAARADCKDQVRELRQEIKDDHDKYTQKARAKPQKELVAAQAQIASPIKCQKHLHKARRALRDGKD